MTIAMRSLFLGAYINDITNMLIITGDPVPSLVGAYYSDDMDEGCRMSYKMPLGRLGLEKGDKFKYLFDFGDEWRFQCRVMQELEEKTKSFRVIKAVGDPPAQYPGWDDEEL